MASPANPRLVTMIDLHTHSTASDGSLSPAALIRLARKINLTAVALCDHDTTAGLQEAAATAAEIGQQFVPGIELSATWQNVTVHIVGLYITPGNKALQEMLSRTRGMRDRRNPQIITALRRLGIDITMADVTSDRPGDSVGRPHIAKQLVKKGIVQSTDEAFEKYLGEGASAHVPKDRLPASEAIDTIRAAGGVPILAHPHQTGLLLPALDTFVGELTELGLLGIEVFCSGYKSNRSTAYTRIARRHGLVRSGGSDFHGDAKPAIRLGRGIGNLFVRDDLLAPIQQAAMSMTDVSPQ
jgi:3',5'-nucleoside bisphosphate phosphatase